MSALCFYIYSQSCSDCIKSSCWWITADFSPFEPHPVEQVHRCSHRLALLQIFKPSEGQTGVTWTHKDRISLITVHTTGQFQQHDHSSVKAATLWEWSELPKEQNTFSNVSWDINMTKKKHGSANIFRIMLIVRNFILYYAAAPVCPSISGSHHSWTRLRDA